MNWLTTVLLIGLGGATGATLRVALGHRLDAAIATGTLAANILASLILGVLWEWQGFADWGVAAEWNNSASLGLQVGLIGALSTWSSLANEVATQLRAGETKNALLALEFNLGLGIFAAWIGLQIGAAL